MSKTDENLWAAFSGESQANQKYSAFAARAEKQGQTQAAKLFRAAAEAESIHARNHLKALQAINATADNLQEAIAGETHEFKSMYPEMIAQAESEGHKRGLKTLQWANEVEKVHAQLYQEMLENLEDQEDYPYYVCPACGHTAAQEPPEKCPVCGTLAKFYNRVD